MTKKVYRVRNWQEYNKGLVSRGSLTFWFSKDVIDDWQKKQAMPMEIENTLIWLFSAD